MEQKLEKRRISPTLINMEIGAEEIFPIKQLNSINSTIQRLQSVMIEEGLKWSAMKCENGYKVKVIRIS